MGVPAASSAYAAGMMVAADNVVSNAATANVDFFMIIILVISKTIELIDILADYFAVEYKKG